MKKSQKTKKSLVNYGFRLVLMLIVLCCSGLGLQAQTYAPPGIPFQGLLRDNSNMPAKTREIIVRTTLLDKNNTVVYGEMFGRGATKLLTNQDGVFTVILGQSGDQIAGLTAGFSAINWGAGPYYLKVEVAMPATIAMPSNWDYTKDFKDMGTTQLWSVPYALSSGSTTSISGGKPLTSKDNIIKVINGDAALLVAAQLGIDTTNLAKLMINSPSIRDSIIKIINSTPASRDSIIKTITNTIQQEKIAGRKLGNLADGVIKIANGDSVLLRAAQLGIDTAKLGKLILNSSIRDSVLKIFNTTAGRDSIINTISTIIQQEKVAGVRLTVGRGLLGSGKLDSALLKAGGLVIDSVGLASIIKNTPAIKDTLAVIITSPGSVRDSITKVINTTIANGVTGKDLSAYGLRVSGGTGAVLKDVNLKLDSTVVAKQVGKLPVSDSIVSLVTTNTKVRDSIIKLIRNNVNGNVGGKDLTAYGLIVNNGAASTLKDVSLVLDSTVIAQQIGKRPILDSIVRLITTNPQVRDSIIKLIINTPAARDSIINAITKEIRQEKVAGVKLTVGRGLLGSGKLDSALLKAGGLVIDSVGLASIIKNTPAIKDTLAVIITKPGIIRDSIVKAATNSSWSLTGNAGTSTTTNFIGTTDKINLILKTNTTTALTIDTMQRVGIGTATPAASAIVDMTATNKAFLLPRVNNPSVVATPVEGMMVYDTTAKCFKGYQNGAWTGCIFRNNSNSSGGTAVISGYNCSPEGTPAVGTLLKGIAVANVTQTIQVNVTETGTYNMSATANGVVFSGMGDLTATGWQTIVLTASGTPLQVGDSTFSLNTTPDGCTFKRITILTTSGGTSVLTLTNCSQDSVGILIYNKPVPSGVTQTIGVNVTQIGSYNINATANGVTFNSGIGNFTTTGTKTIVLTATGKPTTTGKNNFSLNTTPSCVFSRNVTIVSFTDPTTWTLTKGGTGTFTPTLSGDTLKITDIATGNSANAAYFNTKIATDKDFTASFTYRSSYKAGASQYTPADGFAFVLQNNSNSSVGNIGVAKGVPTSNDYAVVFNIYGGNSGVATASNSDATSLTYASSSPVSIVYSGSTSTGTVYPSNPIAVKIAYTKATNSLTVTLVDTVTAQSKTYNYTPNFSFSTTAYVGFTGSTGGGYADQKISNFSFVQ